LRIIVQRVKYAKVIINSGEERSIGQGLMILLGIEESDTQVDVEWLCAKISRLRIFNDDAGVMNLSVMDIQGELMLISQFTLHASTKKGNRPSYIRAAKPETAIPLYDAFITTLRAATGCSVVTGTFGAHMEITLLNDGPVTLILDSRNKE
jgi:D-tyrosyl-tRNA(Tyr) deacylase